MTINLISKKQIKGLKKEKNHGEKRIDLKEQRHGRSREGDRKLKQPKDVTRWKAKKQTTEHR